MKRALILVLLINVSAGVCFGQASGNISYSQGGGNAKAEQNERSKRAYDVPQSATSIYVDASVLMNVKADEFVAVFGINKECATIPECNQKMDATVSQFSADLKQLGINSADVFVDFAAQNRIYGYQIAGNIAKENLVGFELKKNIAIHYSDKMLLDRLVIAASKSGIFDLIKVDYIVKDHTPIQNRLFEEAAKVIEQKQGRYARLLGVIRLLPPAQVVAERPSIYFPTDMYDSYSAYESEEIGSDYYRDKYTIQRARKSRTFFFNPLNADGFDVVINPVVIEPVVQFTLYLKMRYEIKQPDKPAEKAK